MRTGRNSTEPKIDDKAKAMDRAMRLLAARAHYSGELRAKLLKKNFTRSAVDYVESECYRLRLLDDEQFAFDLCRELHSRGYGIYQIKFRMRKKGIPADMIEQAVNGVADENPDAEREAAEQAFASKMRMLIREDDPRKKREKLYRYMMTRGFSGEIIRSLLEENDL